MLHKCLGINELLGNSDVMARQYGNLGLIFRTRGDLDRAEDMHRKSIAMNESLHRKEGMANQYANLGLVYEARGDATNACAHWRKSRDLFAQIGMPHMVTQVEGWMREAGCGEA